MSSQEAQHVCQKKPSLSTGEGIGIAGAWLSGAAVTIMLLWMVHNSGGSDAEMSGTTGLLFIVLIASPMIAAYCITARIIDKN